MQIVSKLMGLEKEDLVEFSLMYWGSSESSMKANLLENYTYHVKEDIKNSDTHVVLWCGSKEPYAIKSHDILKKYLKNYEEKKDPWGYTSKVPSVENYEEIVCVGE